MSAGILSPWISLDGYSAMRVVLGTDPTLVENRRAFIEKTPRVFDGTAWVGGPKGTGCGSDQSARVEQAYGFNPISQQWCDHELTKLGYVLTEEEIPTDPVGISFQDCVWECWRNQVFMSEYRRLTGHSTGLDKRTPIDMMIDKAVGRDLPALDDKEAVAFLEFVRDYIWLRVR